MEIWFVGVAGAQLALLGWSFKIVHHASARLWMLRVIITGMIYDNLMLSLGNLGVGSAWYLGASAGRFVLHAALLPLLIPFALSALRRSAVLVANRRDFTAFCWIVAIIAWCYGFWFDVGQLELIPTEVLGHTRLTSLSELPPLGTIAVNLLLILAGVILWQRTGWPGLFAGALCILLVNMSVGSQPWGYLASNGAEVVFVFSLLLTERFLARKHP